MFLGDLSSHTERKARKASNNSVSSLYSNLITAVLRPNCCLCIRNQKVKTEAIQMPNQTFQVIRSKFHQLKLFLMTSKL